MSDIVIQVENLSKRYRLGQIGGKRLVDDVNRWWARIRGKEDPLSKVGSSYISHLLSHASQPPAPGSELSATADVFWALRDVSFEVKQGEVLGIIGRNGAGKSTLLKILSRVTAPTSGEVRVKGRIASLLEVGTGFHPDLTGRENIFLNGAILGMTKVEISRKFDEIVDFAEVEKFIDTPVKRYSSGMYVRLAFAVAAHLEPEILVVDEVLAVGDAEFQKKCLGKMKDVTNQGRTVLFVSHQMGAINSLCKDVIFIARGQIKEIGAAARVVANYLSDSQDSKMCSLDDLRLRGFGKEVKFTDIRLLTENGENILFGQPIKIILKVESNKNFSDLSIGTSIFHISGTCIGNAITNTFNINSAQKKTMQLLLPNINLAPDSYYIGASIGKGGRTVHRDDFDIVIGRPRFQVLPMSSDGKELIAYWQKGWGNIILKNAQLEIISEI